MNLRNPRRDKHKPAYNAVRPLVLERDGHACRKCGERALLEVHHLFGYEDNSVESMVTLCWLCHGRAPMAEAYWEWEKNGQSGRDHFLEFVRGVVDADDEKVLELAREFFGGKREFESSLAKPVSGGKPYGFYPGEKYTLDLILLHGKQGFSAKSIAERLNEAQVSPRSCAKWHPFVVAKILHANLGPLWTLKLSKEDE
jgi:hypothetical protein